MIVVRMYFAVLISVLITLLGFAVIMFLYEGHTAWAEEGIGKLLSIIELVVGAAIGSLSTAVAFTFAKKDQ